MNANKQVFISPPIDETCTYKTSQQNAGTLQSSSDQNQLPAFSVLRLASYPPEARTRNYSMTNVYGNRPVFVVFPEEQALTGLNVYFIQRPMDMAHLERMALARELQKLSNGKSSHLLHPVYLEESSDSGH